MVVKVMTIISDRPERCSINCILSHTGKTTVIWCYSALIVPESLSSCNNCLKQRLNHMKKYPQNSYKQFDNRRCENCADWNYGNLKLLKAPPPDNYPRVKRKVVQSHQNIETLLRNIKQI